MQPASIAHSTKRPRPLPIGVAQAARKPADLSILGEEGQKLVAKLIAATRREGPHTDRIAAGLERIVRKMHRFDAQRGKVIAFIRTQTWQGGQSTVRTEIRDREIIRIDAMKEEEIADSNMVNAEAGYSTIDCKRNLAMETLLRYCISAAERAVMIALTCAAGDMHIAAELLGLDGIVTSEWSIKRFIRRLRERVPASVRAALLDRE